MPAGVSIVSLEIISERGTIGFEPFIGVNSDRPYHISGNVSNSLAIGIGTRLRICTLNRVSPHDSLLSVNPFESNALLTPFYTRHPIANIVVSTCAYKRIVDRTRSDIFRMFRPTAATSHESSFRDSTRCLHDLTVSIRRNLVEGLVDQTPVLHPRVASSTSTGNIVSTKFPCSRVGLSVSPFPRPCRRRRRRRRCPWCSGVSRLPKAAA